MNFETINRTKLFRIAGIAISLACLFYVRGFRYLLYPNLNGYYEHGPPLLELEAILICVFLTALLFALVLLGIEAFGEAKLTLGLRVLFLVLGLACFISLNDEILNWLIGRRTEPLNYELPLLIFGLSLLTALRPTLTIDLVVHRFQSITLVLLPIGLFFIFQASFVISGLGGISLSPQNIENPSVQSNLSHRVVWLIFDEFDYATIEYKPAQVQMPVFERLVNESFVAEKALPPNFWTIDSLPSLLSGQVVSSIEPISEKNLSITLQYDDEPATLGDGRNIFAQVKKLGGSSGVLGWVHPYPRLFQESLDFGYWQGTQVVRCDTILECVLELAGDAFQTLPVINPFESYRRLNSKGKLNENRFVEGQLKRAPYMREWAIRMASDERLDFVFVHFSIPHARFLDRDLNLATKGYFQALEAVDETLCLIRKEMESKGLWDSTTLIISGDHWWRFKTQEYLSFLPNDKRQEVMQDQRVPFIVKLAGRSDRFDYPEQFNTVATHNIVLGLLAGELNSGSDIARRIEKLRLERPLEINHIPKRERPTDDVFERNSGGFVADPSWTPR